MIDTNERAQMWQLVEDTIARWRDGEQPDAAAFLARHPDIGARKTLALDLIHEELCLRKEAGDTMLASTFVERFPDYRSSIVKMLAVEQYGESHPEFAQALGEGIWPQVGQEYQGFEILEPLGRGALARVYLARETAMGRRPVVIKVSQHGGHEAHLLGKLEHENVVTAYSVKQDDATGMTVICMPLLGTATGLDLLDAAFRNKTAPATAEVIGQVARQYQPAGLVKPQSLREAFPFVRRTYVEGVVWLGKELAEGLEAAGKLGVAHRDIKPSNVLLAWSGRPMLLDFNLSSGEDQASDRIGGTLAYMPPERIALLLAGAAATDEEVDPRPDIFSLGALLFELLTGRLPVQPIDADRNDEAALKKWLAARSEPIAPPSRLNRQVEASIDRIVARCLAVDPAKRYAAAGELAAELAAYLSPRQMAARWLRRHRRGVLAGGLLAATGFATGAAYWATRPPLDEQKYQEGLRLYDAGDYKGAVRALNISLQAKPDSVKALFARGQSYYQLREFTSAQSNFKAATLLDDRALFWFCAGCCGLGIADKSGPECLYNALQRHYDEAEVYCNLGICFEISYDRPKAIKNYSHALDVNPRLQVASLELANVLLVEALAGHGERLKEAVTAIDRAVQLGPPSRRLFLLAVRIHGLAAQSKLESPEFADMYFRRWVEFGGLPEEKTADQVLGRLYRKHGRLDELRPDPSVAAAEDPPRGVLPPDAADLSKLTTR